MKSFKHGRRCDARPSARPRGPRIGAVTRSAVSVERIFFARRFARRVPRRRDRLERFLPNAANGCPESRLAIGIPHRPTSRPSVSRDAVRRRAKSAHPPTRFDWPARDLVAKIFLPLKNAAI